MTSPRQGHVCELLPGRTNEILVVGGDSLETDIFNVDTLERRVGPVLPEYLEHPVGILMADGTFLLVGGSDSGAIYELIAAPGDGSVWEWKERPENLAKGRTKHTAVLIDETVANCY